MKSQPEFWLRGPLPDYPLELQPVVHAVLQAQLETHELMNNFPAELLWEKPAGMASPAFHLMHMGGVLDRLATYAKEESLTAEQFEYLKKEGQEHKEAKTEDLIHVLDQMIEDFLAYLAQLDPNSLGDFRGVGRAKLPSNVRGLLFHAAEHMQRHFGQLLVTVKVLLHHQKS